MKKLLALVDTPTENTGFGCVCRNTLKYWQAYLERIDIWGINYNGWPHEYPYRIYPAGRRWAAVDNLKRLLDHINQSDYTHLWILQDTFLLSDTAFPKALNELCERKKVRIITYFPVDAPLEEEWLEIVKRSDAAATYTEYGRRETEKFGVSPIEVIPHGVDAEVFHPLEQSKRFKLRQEFFPEWGGATILVNVNRNERRKSMVHSLQVLRELIQRYGPKYKLYLHCVAQNPGEAMDLFRIGASLGLQYGQDWQVPDDEAFPRGIGNLTTEQLNMIYNACDLCITTTLGEGWGLSITEAAAAGLKVVAPNNTSIPDIERIIDGEESQRSDKRIFAVPCISTGIVHPNDNSRVRYPVDIEAMADQIETIEPYDREPMREVAKATLSWPRIAAEWLRLF